VRLANLSSSLNFQSNNMSKETQFKAMLSATARDLADQRSVAEAACIAQEFFPVWMKHLPARDADGFKVSMEMVDKADIYIGIYAWRYGWVPDFDNPRQVSITELEFDRALERKASGKIKEILIFIMDEAVKVAPADIEMSDVAQQKLKAFKERASKKRVVGYFTSTEDLQRQISEALTAFKLRNMAEAPPEPSEIHSATTSSIPTPPAFYAAPDYIGRHTFIGRKAQLKTLSEWAQPSDPTSVLLFEAIGGNGKSMLTWEWTTKHATAVRSNWAGRFWYSFYERGAVMRAFCQHALAYMTQQPLAAFEKNTTAEMRVELLALLHRQPWLLILDGLERVLVAYHRIDAAEVPDEEVNRPTDKILDRDPCDAIRDEDTDLLRALAAAAPSKILISSRLIPRSLLNQAGIPLPGVKPLVLPGLDEADAEELLRSCGIQGTSADIRYYLTSYCGNHPLVIGVLAGLINSPGPHRGNFDSWAADPEYGAKLNLASLDLIQSRNHILRAAMEALEPPSRQLLSTLALMSNAVDYETVAAFNPHLPPEREEVEKPEPPEQHWRWNRRTDEEKGRLRKQFEADLAEWKAYEHALQVWRDSEAVREAPKKLGETIQDLEHRGLLQYDSRTRRYDLHPVVRGVAAGGMKVEDKEDYGQRVVDHYSSQPHNPYEEARTMEDVEIGLNIVRTLLKLGRYQEAADVYQGDLSNALTLNLEAHVEALSLLRPFFPASWGQLPKHVDTWYASYLTNDAAIALHSCGELQIAVGAYGAALRMLLETKSWDNVNICLRNISSILADQRLLAKALRVNRLALDLAVVRNASEDIFKGLLSLFDNQSRNGQWQEAETTWRRLDPMGREWSRSVYRQGSAEHEFAKSQFWQGTLQEDHLTAAASLAQKDGNRPILRNLHWMRGSWRLEQGEWTLAAASFDQALTMARERRLVDGDSETGLALAKFHLRQLTDADARCEAERLAQLRRPAHRYLALLWQAIGDLDQAKHHTLAAYKEAWADGEPYVHRYELTKTTGLLNELGVPVPNLPLYDPAKDEPFPWEAGIRAAIEKLRAEKKGGEE
jgi:tetratricopeptide (TPR) repeat protein